ncbi:MAG: glycosyltransferase family 39 protein [Candidatus Andersenbacteria bacterium]
MKRGQALALLLLLLLFAGAIRSYELTARSLWFDEAFSWRLIQFSLPEMIARDAADVHPPLYYIFLKGWGAVFGTSLLSLRSFSVTLGLAAIAMAYGFAASAWRSRAVGILAATLMALAGWQIQYAWEARMYTLGIFFTLLSSWLLLQLVRTTLQRQAASWLLAVLYGITAAALAYVHYFAFFTLAAHALFVLMILVRRTRWRLGEMLGSQLLWIAAASGILAVVLYAPWIPVFLAQNQQVQDSYWVPPIGGWSIPDTFYRMLIPTSGIPPHTGPELVFSALPILAVLALWIWLLVGCKKRSESPLALKGKAQASVVHEDTCEAAWLVMLSASVPFFLAIGISFIGQSLYQDRFLVFTHAFILIGLAAFLVRIRPIWLRRTAITVVILLFAVLSVRFWNEIEVRNKPGAAGATAHIFEQRTDDEPVFVSSAFVYFAVEHYAHEDFDGATDPTLLAEGAALHFAGGPILTDADVISPAVLDTLPQDSFWLVDTTGFGGSELEVVGWRSVERTVYPEVFAHQADVIVHRYVRQ